jgi:NADPH:quinone reductase-like Zn-dependent oxidoreductase
MRAILATRYGPPESLVHGEVDRPAMDEDSILVRVRATSVNALDWHSITGRPMLVRASNGLRRPSDPIPGVDLAGVVEAVGPSVTGFSPGDEVIGHKGNAWAELVAVKAHHLVTKPRAVSFEAAAALPVAGLTALQGMRDIGRVGPGSRVLVIGAGGGVGTMAVQVAKALGGTVAATTRGESLETVRSIGADEVVDHQRVDVTRRPARYDVVADVGGRLSLGELARIMAPGGTLVQVAPGPGDWIGPVTRIAAAWFRTKARGQRMPFFLAHHDHDDLVTLRDWLADGTIRPVIDRCYPLDQAAAATRRVLDGKARGKVVLTVSEPGGDEG